MRSWRPDDIVIVDAPNNGHIYKVGAVKLGAVGQVDLIELRPVNQTPQRGPDDSINVPLFILEAACDHSGRVNHYRKDPETE